MKYPENMTDEERIRLIMLTMQINISPKSLSEVGRRYAQACDSGKKFMQQFDPEFAETLEKQH